MLTESYSVLQVPYGAGMPQVRAAYRQLVLQYHPDRNSQPNAQEMFLRIQAAYEYLQHYHTVATQTKYVQPEEVSTKPQAEQDWEKYQHVYDPPANPKEYDAWAKVAIERARRQAERDRAAYVQRMLVFQQQWWYAPARIVSYLVLLIGTGVGIGILLIPVFFWWAGYYRFILLGIALTPMGIRILSMMKEFRQDIRKSFGEDLKTTSE